MKIDRKYCCDPFKQHKTLRKKDLRDVTDQQAKNYPSLVSMGLKICSNGRIMISKYTEEMETEIMETFPQHPEISDITDKSPEEAEVKANEHDDSMFSSPDSELHYLDK